MAAEKHYTATVGMNLGDLRIEAGDTIAESDIPKASRSRGDWLIRDGYLVESELTRRSIAAHREGGE